MTLKKYGGKSYLITIFYYEGCMLISLAVDFIKILENLHGLIMGVKL
jgi:hypothetical protein